MQIQIDGRMIIAVTGVVCAVGCTIAELLRPARPISYRALFPRDLAAFAIYMALVVPAANYGVAPLLHLFKYPGEVLALPLPVRVVIFYLVADLSSYWLHRLMHTRHVWRVHKWHHAPKYMYWMAGVRASLPQQFLFNMQLLFAAPFMAGAPGGLFLCITLEGILRNDWMHMNVAWRSNWLEWLIVTPRYHHIHHSDDPALHHGNYGSLFSIWDRIFNTRIDPDKVTGPLTFGTGEEDPVVRLIAGV